MEAAFDQRLVEEVCHYLSKEIPDQDEEVLSNFRRHKINGSVFLELTEEYLRELAPLLGDRIQVKKSITKALNNIDCLSVHSPPWDGESETLGEYSSPPSTVSTSASRITSPPPSIVGQSFSRITSPPPSIVGNASSRTKTPSPATTPQSQSSRSLSPSPSCKSGGSKSSCTPSTSVNWARSFVLPSRFSKSTMQCLKEEILTSAARDDIVDSVATLMMLHTMVPTSQDYAVVCERLVTATPCLRDSVGSGFDSWKRKLRMKFKNLRRPDRSKKIGLSSPQPKKLKLTEEGPDDASREPTASDMEEYRQHIKELQKLYSSGKWSTSMLSSLLQETAKLRRRWIKEERPPVREVLDKFPCLEQPTLLIQEFMLMVDKQNAYEKKWEVVQKKVLKYATMETRKAIKDILKKYSLASEDTDDENSERTAAYTLTILASLLCAKGRKKSSIFFPIEGEVLCVEEEIAIEYPYVTAFGPTLDDLQDPRLVIEDKILVMPSLSMAVHCCFAAYYVFDMQYPVNAQNLLLFLESMIYELPASRRLPTTVATVIDSISKVKV